MDTDMETRLGDIREFAKNLSIEGKNVTGKERLYYGIWQIGMALAIMGTMWGFFYGIALDNISAISIVSMLLYFMLLLFYDIFFRYRFVLEKNKKKTICDGIFFLVFVVVLYGVNIVPKRYQGLFMLPGWSLWVILGIRIVLYVVGKILFLRYMDKVAEIYHWDFSDFC